MKREIVCPTCANTTYGFSLYNDFEQDKTIKYSNGDEAYLIRGHLLQSCVCDVCGRPMNEADKAAAVSLLNPAETGIVLLPEDYSYWQKAYLDL
jgi:hypothetical protein